MKRIKVIQGGSSAGKTMAIISILVDRAIKNPGITVSIVSRDLPHLKKGAMKDFKWFMKDVGRWNRDHWHSTDSVYTFSNGSRIEFLGIDDEDKAKGPRRDILYINEANRLTFGIYHQLAKRTDKEIFIDYNPTGRFWVHDEVVPGANADFIILTFKDNEARPSNVDEEMRESKFKHDTNVSQYWVNDWRVYGLGLIGQLKGAVWTDWKKLDEIPADAVLLGLGLDFGFSNSPTAVIAVYEWKGTYLFDEWIYETKLHNSSTAQMIQSFPAYQGQPVYCDSASPQNIAELILYGVNAHPCASKQDIRTYAIQKIGKQTFYVTTQSVNFIENIELYVFAETKTGDLLNVPKKENDHGPDAIIYFIGTADKYDGTYL